MRPAPDFLEFLYKMDPEYYAELTSARLGNGKVQREFKTLLAEHPQAEARPNLFDNIERAPLVSSSLSPNTMMNAIADKVTRGNSRPS